jgi:integrating conjugative element protein (TIGR03752 family)
MKVRSNTLVKLLVPAMLLCAIIIGVKSCSQPEAPAAKSENPLASSLANLSPDELNSLGILGDTPEDTLHTLIGALNKVRDEQKQLRKENEELRKQNRSDLKGEKDVSSQVNEALTELQVKYDERQQLLQNEQQSLKDKLQSLLSQFDKNGAGPQGKESDIPLGLGLDSFNDAIASEQNNVTWISPADQPNTIPGQSKDAPSFPVSFLEDNPLTRQKSAYELQVKGHTSDINSGSQSSEAPVFTLPENSTLIGSRAMTALLGRVPINGTVLDPYPFKVLIGKDNLTANGIALGEIEGAVVSGTASGDWTLSCVRGQINTITFVFSNGTVRTLPQPAELASGNSNTASNKSDIGTGGGIGWISDENGIPCISGTRKSNASTYLPTLFALSAAAAAGQTMNESQQTSQSNGNGGTTSSLTGDAGKAAIGKAIAGGMSETNDWVKQRYGQMFDAIYVPPGARLALHITRQLRIDYEVSGRKVRYDFSMPNDSQNADELD